MKHIIAHGNHRWSLEGTQMEVEVILASQGPAPCKPIYTLRMRYPRIIHAEAKTHRVLSLDSMEVTSGLDIMGDRDLSRNARSSRAVPVLTMLDEIRKKPFVPWHWGANQRGMQAGGECNAHVLIPDWDDINFHGTPHRRPYDREEAWLFARDKALDVAEAFSDAGYHKQICNRLLEPFMWIDTLVTATEWENFLWLRDHEAAEPHLRDLARLVKQAIDSAEIRTLEPGQWHLPYITEEDWRTDDVQHKLQPAAYEFLCKISASRCARISYKPFDGDASYERELERYESLVSSDRVHASPLEHQATPDVYFTGKELCQFPPEPGWEHPELAGNLGPGWVQFRKLVPGENHTS